VEEVVMSNSVHPLERWLYQSQCEDATGIWADGDNVKQPVREVDENQDIDSLSETGAIYGDSDDRDTTGTMWTINLWCCTINLGYIIDLCCIPGLIDFE
jgi:hypothetical protein